MRYILIYTHKFKNLYSVVIGISYINTIIYYRNSRGHHKFTRPVALAADRQKELPFSGEYLHTINHLIRLPKVIILKVFDRLPIKEVKFHRNNIFERDKHRCQYCGNQFIENELNLDHVIPRHHGGRTSWENVVTSCIRCNSKKADRLPHEAGMRLIRKPAKPKWRPFVSVAENKEKNPSWDYFLNPLKLS